MIIFIFFFFFSSRRRHTRWPRDWSSDVCSSDLGDRSRMAGVGLAGRMIVFNPRDYNSGERSEERRVGKEGRSRWAPYHLKKKNTERGEQACSVDAATRTSRSAACIGGR